jgi:hypothetical protein
LQTRISALTLRFVHLRSGPIRVVYVGRFRVVYWLEVLCRRFGWSRSSALNLDNLLVGSCELTPLACFLLQSARMIQDLWNAFVELIVTPFQYLQLTWGIVPLYFGLLLNEMTSGKANYRTAIQTGFSFLWAGAQWLYPYFQKTAPGGPRLELGAMLPINMLVTALVLVLGAAALICGLRRRYPRYGSFLGHTRFSNSLMITLFPIQARFLTWTWERLIAILLFAFPVWVVLHFSLKPLRNGKQR